MRRYGGSSRGIGGARTIHRTVRPPRGQHPSHPRPQAGRPGCQSLAARKVGQAHVNSRFRSERASGRADPTWSALGAQPQAPDAAADYVSGVASPLACQPACLARGPRFDRASHVRRDRSAGRPPDSWHRAHRAPGIYRRRCVGPRPSSRPERSSLGPARPAKRNRAPQGARRIPDITRRSVGELEGADPPLVAGEQGGAATNARSVDVRVPVPHVHGPLLRKPIVKPAFQ